MVAAVVIVALVIFAAGFVIALTVLASCGSGVRSGPTR